MTTLEIVLIALCVILVLLPPKYDPAIRIKEWQMRRGAHPEAEGMQFISWYQPPLREHREYIAKPVDSDGWIYVRDRNMAHRFDCYAAADIATPKYDGSAGIERRAGVERVA